MHVDTIRGNSADQITLNDNVIITGNLGLSGSFKYSRSWKIIGSSLNVLSSKGRYPFTVSRPAGYSVGVCCRYFGSKPCSHAKCVINITIQANGCFKVWDTTTPTTNGFHIVSFNAATVLINCTYYHSGIAYVNTILY